MLAATSLVVLLSSYFTYTSAGYILNVRVHSYNNPTNDCPVCSNSCCDNFDSTQQCTGADRCDNTFYYCLRPLGIRSPLDHRNLERCGGNDRLARLSSINQDGEEIDFSGNHVLGLPNPIPLRGRTFGWEGAQVYVEVTDADGKLNADEFIDMFEIDVERIPIGIETAPVQYNGSFGFAYLTLSFKVECYVSHFFPDCDPDACERRGNCACYPGYTGAECEVNIDECQVADCPENSICVDGVNSFTCQRLEGCNVKNCTETDMSANPTEVDSIPATVYIIPAIGVALILLAITIVTILISIKLHASRQTHVYDYVVAAHNVSRTQAPKKTLTTVSEHHHHVISEERRHASDEQESSRAHELSHQQKTYYHKQESSHEQDFNRVMESSHEQEYAHIQEPQEYEQVQESSHKPEVDHDQESSHEQEVDHDQESSHEQECGHVQESQESSCEQEQSDKLYSNRKEPALEIYKRYEPHISTESRKSHSNLTSDISTNEQDIEMEHNPGYNIPLEHSVVACTQGSTSSLTPESEANMSYWHNKIATQEENV